MIKDSKDNMHQFITVGPLFIFFIPRLMALLQCLAFQLNQNTQSGTSSKAISEARKRKTVRIASFLFKSRDALYQVENNSGV